MKSIMETRAKEKLMDFSRRFEQHVALKKDELPFDKMKPEESKDAKLRT